VSYLGNLVGETGDEDSPMRVTAADLVAVRRALNKPAALDSRFDINHDGRVSALDLGLIKANLNRALGETPPPGVATLRVQRLWAEAPAEVTG
jgi:hypothetical protein